LSIRDLERERLLAEHVLARGNGRERELGMGVGRCRDRGGRGERGLRKRGGQSTRNAVCTCGDGGVADDFRARTAHSRQSLERRESRSLSLEQSRSGLFALSRVIWVGAGISFVLLVDAANRGHESAHDLADHAAAGGAARMVCGRGNAFPMGIARRGVRFVGRGADRLEKHQKPHEYGVNRSERRSRLISIAICKLQPDRHRLCCFSRGESRCSCLARASRGLRIRDRYQGRARSPGFLIAVCLSSYRSMQ